jgi:glycosyltransferase involved in cell wall biosynthesis
MPGAWELTQNEVVVAVLTRETVHIAWALNFRNFILPNESAVIVLAGMPFDHARNEAVERALENNFKYIMFVDDDIIMPPDTFVKLRSHDVDIVSGVYYRRSEPLNVCMLRYEQTKEGQTISHVKEYKLNELIEVDFVGAGCLLIKTDVFKRLKYPWFEWRVDHKELPPLKKFSEDFAFCETARENGYKINVDTSVQCTHIGHSQISLAEGLRSVRF